jgi:hypothetical protein
MSKKKVLCICGSYNQTTMMHKISGNLDEYDIYYTPYYSGGFLNVLVKAGLLDFTILGRNSEFQKQTETYLINNGLEIDYAGSKNEYDLILTCSDLIIPENIKQKKLILVQEGMTDPENFMYYVVKMLKLPRYLASTSATGLSDAYDSFCVASEGYKKLFVKKGVRPDKLSVTGIPNFDNAREYLKNSFPHKDYCLVATSDTRETFKFENRKKFILDSLKIADGRDMIFKLHPNENKNRSTREINKYAPHALVYSSGNTNHMIANCETLITKYSSVVYIGLALGKDVHSYFDLKMLKELTPLQNGGKSSINIANVCKEYLQ